MAVEEDPEMSEDDVPIFTAELEALKRKERGEEDEKMEDGSGEDEEDEMQEMANGEDIPSEFEDSEEEKEDFTIRKTDALLVAASTEKDFSNLEVYVYEYKTSSLYVHHDIMLSSYPLCLEWIKTYNGQKTNLVAVGTFLP
jgi:periodic tryptophan protein 1